MEPYTLTEAEYKRIVEDKETVRKTTSDGVREISLAGWNDNGSPILADPLVETTPSYDQAKEEEKIANETIINQLDQKQILMDELKYTYSNKDLTLEERMEALLEYNALSSTPILFD